MSEFGTMIFYGDFQSVSIFVAMLQVNIADHSACYTDTEAKTDNPNIIFTCEFCGCLIHISEIQVGGDVIICQVGNNNNLHEKMCGKNSQEKAKGCDG